MRAPRMTTRRWMIAVALASIGMGAGIQTERRIRHLLRAESLHREALDEEFWNQGCVVFETPRTHYERAMWKKYSYAARHPWLAVPPDPPPPE